MKKFVAFLVVFIVFLVIGSFVLYKYIFTGAPRDLGVVYTEVDQANAYANNGVESVAITPSADNPDGVVYEGQKDVKTSFSSAEISALNNSVKWVNYPISNIQIKINPDGTGEASGTLDVRKILGWVSFTHSVKEIESQINKYKIGLNPPFYLKGKVSVTNNKVTLTPQTIEVGRIVIPQNLVSENIPLLEKFAQTRITAVPNLMIRSLNLDGGRVNLDATMPEKELTVQK